MTKVLHFLLTLIGLLLMNSVLAQYNEATVAGTALENPTTTWAAGDDSTTLINLGFTFPFGSISNPNNTNQVYINSNGGLSLTSWSAYNNSALPTTPSTIIAPYWDDLNPAAGGTVKYSTFGSVGNKRFVISWNQVPLYGTTTQCTFQVVLYENGNIRFRYDNNSQCNGSGATVGIQENSNDYSQHSFNQTINLSQDILYTPTATPPPGPDPAIPLAVGVCDDFERDLGNWTISGSGIAEISTKTANSPTHSLDLSATTVTATSIPVNTTSNFKDVTIWIRRGADAFSEDPDPNEDFAVDYLNSSGTWVTLETFLGSGTDGQIYNRTYPMPANAKHAGFRLRLRLLTGSGANYDYWHVDDVCLNALPLPSINIQKVSSVLSDGINASNPKRIPGALVEYTITATNSGDGTTDNNSVVITDSIPSNTALYVNDISGAGTGPVRFVDGSPPSGLNYTFSGLASTTDNLSFSNDGGTSYNYTPVPNILGVDTAVTNIRMSTTGQFSASGGAGNPNFQFKFRVKVQ